MFLNSVFCCLKATIFCFKETEKLAIILFFTVKTRINIFQREISTEKILKVSEENDS